MASGSEPLTMPEVPDRTRRSRDVSCQTGGAALAPRGGGDRRGSLDLRHLGIGAGAYVLTSTC